MKLTVRQAELADLPALAALFDLYRQFYECAPDRALAHDFIEKRLSAGDSVLLLAQTGEGESIGFCQLYPSFCSLLGAPVYILYDLFVTPQARRSGAARALLTAARARAAADGKARMDLTTAKTNHAAQALYESLGWVRDEVFYAYTLAVAT